MSVYKKLDQMYGLIDFKIRPFCHSQDYYDWVRKETDNSARNYLVPGSVLDSGGGFGQFRKFVKNRFYLNADVSYNITKYSGDYKIVSNGERLAVKASTFDNIVSVGVLGFVEIPEKYLRECLRVLKTKGKMILVTSRDDQIKRLIFSIWFWILGVYLARAVINKIFYNRKTPSAYVINNYKYYALNELKKLLDKSGFKINYTSYCFKQFPGVTCRWLSDIIPQNKYGNYHFFVCEKSTDVKK